MTRNSWRHYGTTWLTTGKHGKTQFETIGVLTMRGVRLGRESAIARKRMSRCLTVPFAFSRFRGQRVSQGQLSMGRAFVPGEPPLCGSDGLVAPHHRLSPAANPGDAGYARFRTRPPLPSEADESLPSDNRAGGGLGCRAVILCFRVFVVHCSYVSSCPSWVKQFQAESGTYTFSASVILACRSLITSSRLAQAVL